ncbi:MAG: MmcQ/YjbR family DNA-binding protein [Bacteroidales bacterium]|nr:MmcQ/YjbR family DNA-binding protein [Bacteroidales bacterium]
MNIENFREYCLSKKAVSESFPFDKTTLVLKVLDKMFALTDLEDDFSINLKCEPEKAILVREKYNAVKEGYHMNKKHWNTIIIDGSIPDSKLKKWIDDSYNSVVSKMTKKNREKLLKM